MFFYRSTDGAYRYQRHENQWCLGNPALPVGPATPLEWDSITAVDLDGDGNDEQFFYRSTDGAYRYYDMKTNGALGTLLSGGTGYSLGWDSITAIDLDGDGNDELFFYRSTDGAYRYYNMNTNGSLGALIRGWHRLPLAGIRSLRLTLTVTATTNSSSTGRPTAPTATTT